MHSSRAVRLSVHRPRPAILADTGGLAASPPAAGILEMQVPGGGLAVTGYLSGGVVNAPVTMSVDDLTATKP